MIAEAGGRIGKEDTTMTIAAGIDLPDEQVAVIRRRYQANEL